MLLLVFFEVSYQPSLIQPNKINRFFSLAPVIYESIVELMLIYLKIYIHTFFLIQMI